MTKYIISPINADTCSPGPENEYWIVTYAGQYQSFCTLAAAEDFAASLSNHTKPLEAGQN